MHNALYAQAGGITSVINASAAGVIETLRSYGQTPRIYAAINGIEGLLDEKLVDLTNISETTLERLKRLPGGAFQACRFDLDTIENRPDQYERLLQIFSHYDIGTFFYNGGNGSMLTAQKVADYCQSKGYPLRCIGVAKTIDNDLALSHCSPGFGSAAKFLASHFLQATLDVQSMSASSTKFFVMEAMGRNVGWLALSAGLVKDVIADLPLIILPAERAFDESAFLARVTDLINSHGYCVCMASEGLRDANGKSLAVAREEHANGKVYTQYGGVAQKLAQQVEHALNIKTHSANPDYLQRSSALCVSATDWQMAYEAGAAAVHAAHKGEHGILPLVQKTQDTPFRWHFENFALADVAELEARVPDHFLTADGMDITEQALEYLRPLVKGERDMKWHDGLPDLRPITWTQVEKKLPDFKK
ncbi:6-phosphofructokinase [Thiomicrospira aerophila AL3]|uniref:Pyrophosphate--fructose 6-phosphate 1-phosphotransferase n=1 Tax=Thiomicrospira aerophila AL3 TaxID=717772 RepID=W0DTX1_9GAMM|nr:6-phosphofructokinase [Thiomicrospira aerophila]AHF00693.1 6-phosphofructokinase [Thiomicrospira aerophila AL3]